MQKKSSMTQSDSRKIGDDFDYDLRFKHEE